MAGYILFVAVFPIPLGGVEASGLLSFYRIVIELSKLLESKYRTFFGSKMYF